MKIAPLAEVKNRLSNYVRQSESSPVIITRNGRPAAVLVAAVTDEEIDDLLISYNRKLRKRLDQIMKQMDQKGGLPEDIFWEDVRKASLRKSARVKRRNRS